MADDPLMEGYVPIEHYRTTDDDTPSIRIRDTPPGKLPRSISVFPTDINFGAVSKDTVSYQQTILVTNTGFDSVTVSEIFVAGDFTGTAPVPITEILPGEVVAYEVRFTPKRTGAVTGAVYFNTGDSAGKECVKLLGSGV